MGESEHQKRHFTSALVFGAFAALGMLCAFASVEDYGHARASRDWPVVQGVILSRTSSKDFRYAYYFEGDAYEGWRKSFLLSDLDRTAETYSAGDSVDVYVDPSRPSLSVLKPGGFLPFFSTALGGSGLLIFIGFAGLVRAMARADLELSPSLDPMDDYEAIHAGAE